MPDIEVTEHDLPDEKMDAICEAGRRALDLARKELDSADVGREHLLAAVSVAMAGAMSCYGETISAEQLIEAINHAANFWEVKDGTVRFRNFSSFPIPGN